MFDFSRMFAGNAAGAGGGEWNTVVNPNVAVNGMLPGGSYGTDGDPIGVNAGAFGQAAGEGLKSYASGMGGDTQSGGAPAGAFTSTSTSQTSGPSPEQQAQAALQAQNAAARQRMAQSMQPSSAAQTLREPFYGRV